MFYLLHVAHCSLVSWMFPMFPPDALFVSGYERNMCINICIQVCTYTYIPGLKIPERLLLEPCQTQEMINNTRYYLAILEDDNELLDIMKACPDWSVRIEVPLTPPWPVFFQPPPPRDPFCMRDELVRSRCDGAVGARRRTRESDGE